MKTEFMKNKFFAGHDSRPAKFFGKFLNFVDNNSEIYTISY